MQTSITFLVRAWDLIWELNPSKAIAASPWSQIPSELSGYVGDISVRPVSVLVSVHLPDQEIIEFHERSRPKWHVFEDFVCLKFSFIWSDDDFEGVRINSRDAGLTEGDSIEAASRYFASIGNSIAQRFILLGNLSTPGLANSRFSMKEAEHGLLEEGSACGSWLDLIYEDSVLYKSKPLRDINLGDCLAWGRDLGGLWRSLPKTNVERAFSYFSRIFYGEYENHLSSVIWAMGALDALYCETSVGLSEKIKKRVPLIFQGIDEGILKKSINNIYRDRSRVYHGDISFMTNFCDPYHELEESEVYMNLFSSLSDLMYIVCGSLQYAIVKNTKSIKFEERLKVAE